MSDQCDLRQLMTRHGVKLTALRLTVLEILGASAQALRAPELLARVRARRPVHKVSIYRILEDFTRRGILRKLAIEDGASLFELACEHHPPHPHFQCHTCKEVQCLQPVPLMRMWSELQGPVGNQADEIEIRVAGICHKCRGAS